MDAAQRLNAELLFRGPGEPAKKSFALLFVSVQPLFFLITAVVLFKVGVGPLPSKQFAVLPKPTKSTTLESGSGQGPINGAVPGLVIAIFPDKPIFNGGRTKSGNNGSGWPLPVGPNCISICWPGWMGMPLVLTKVTVVSNVPVGEEANWNFHWLRLIAAFPRLKISRKLF